MGEMLELLSRRYDIESLLSEDKVACDIRNKLQDELLKVDQKILQLLAEDSEHIGK